MRNASQIVDQWESMSKERLGAAKALLDGGFYRDSISRSYYAAYCAATSQVIGRGIVFAQGRRNPSHEQLPDLIANVGDIPVTDRNKIRHLLYVLRQARENADYRPHAFVNRAAALEAIYQATALLAVLEIDL